MLRREKKSFVPRQGGCSCRRHSGSSATVLKLKKPGRCVRVPAPASQMQASANDDLLRQRYAASHRGQDDEEPRTQRSSQSKLSRCFALHLTSSRSIRCWRMALDVQSHTPSAAMSRRLFHGEASPLSCYGVPLGSQITVATMARGLIRNQKTRNLKYSKRKPAKHYTIHIKPF